MQVASLPKELQTQKTNSLPDNLKSIAEELIAKKFDVKEEPPKKRDPFHDYRYGPGPPAGTGFFEGNIAGFSSYNHGMQERQRGYKDYITVEDRPWDRVRIAKVRIRYADVRSIMEAKHRLDMENLRTDRTIHMNPDFFRVLMRQPDFDTYGKRRSRDIMEGEIPVVGQIFGYDIIEDLSIMDAYMVVRM